MLGDADGDGWKNSPIEDLNPERPFQPDPCSDATHGAHPFGPVEPGLAGPILNLVPTNIRARRTSERGVGAGHISNWK